VRCSPCSPGCGAPPRPSGWRSSRPRPRSCSRSSGSSPSSATGPITHDLGGWPPPIGIEYVLDPLAGYLACIIGLIGLLVVVYPVRTAFDLFPGRGVPLYPLVLLLLTGLMGVVLSGDLFHLFVFLEVYAIATYALVALGGDRAIFASFRYLLLGTLGSGLYLLGVGFLYFSTGSLNMADVASLLPELADDPAILGSMALIVLGLALKMALFPLHVWLPDAHSYSPPGVAALLAAVQVKAGAYALIRILFDVYGPAYTGSPCRCRPRWCGSGAGIVVGSVLAIQQPTSSGCSRTRRSRSSATSGSASGSRPRWRWSARCCTCSTTR
jgi:multicomponent Na+:H+ antiporter subunit D